MDARVRAGGAADHEACRMALGKVWSITLAMQEPTDAQVVFANVVSMKADFADRTDDSIPGKVVRMLQDNMWLKMPDADNAAKSIATLDEAMKLVDEAHRSLATVKATVDDGLGPSSRAWSRSASGP